MRSGTRIRDKEKETYLAQLRLTGNMAESAKVAGIAKQTVYNLKQKDEAFRAAVDDAIDTAVDRLVGEAWRRAHDGVTKPVFWQGKKLKSGIQEYSDVLLMFLIKRHRPEYRERTTLDLTNLPKLEVTVNYVSAGPKANEG